MTQTEIIEALKKVLTNSYSPYSGVKVAAAVQYVVDGKTQVAFGVNVENVSYGLTICAERSAISNARVKGMTTINALYVMSNQPDPISPCGACRQVVTEFIDHPDDPVLCIDQHNSKQWKSTLGALLPNRFDL